MISSLRSLSTFYHISDVPRPIILKEYGLRNCQTSALDADGVNAYNKLERSTLSLVDEVDVE